jgi:Ca-activated chloride channel homolog
MRIKGVTTMASVAVMLAACSVDDFTVSRSTSSDGSGTKSISNTGSARVAVRPPVVQHATGAPATEPLTAGLRVPASAQIQPAQEKIQKMRAEHEQGRQEVARSQAQTQSQLAARRKPAQDFMTASPLAPSISAPPPVESERYANITDNPLKRVAEQAVSTFSIDVDTGAYANVRRFLNSGVLPPANAVRVEELLNYFSYDYPAPTGREVPFRATTEIARTPWNAHTHLLQIGIKGVELRPRDLPPTNLVFLVDVSGSMRSANKIGLLRAGLKMLARQLRPQDRISIAVYAGASGIVLPPTAGDDAATIEAALDSLRTGGSTNGVAGIKLAYALARQSFIAGGINRVMLATDGDFNVGTVNFQALKNLVERERDSGVSLTTLGFGTGNINEHLMEQLANVGNGNYAYIDSAREAHKALVEQMAGTLATIAKDVKIQLEFNPAVVSEYRLIGYENRQLRREDFNNDKVDAGEIGAGHTVTALYEVALVGSRGVRHDALRYVVPTSVVAPPANQLAGEIGHLRIRYKQPGGTQSRLVEAPIATPHASSGAKMSERLQFAAAVAGFGQLLRGGRYTQGFHYNDVLRLARAAKGVDANGYRGEFVQLVNVARNLTPRAENRVPGVAVRD